MKKFALPFLASLLLIAVPASASPTSSDFTCLDGNIQNCVEVVYEYIADFLCSTISYC